MDKSAPSNQSNKSLNDKANNSVVIKSENSEPSENQDNASSNDLSTGRRSFNRGRWLKEEDDKLRKLVNLYGDSNWSEISKFFQDRSDVQCQQRWEKVVNPELVKGPWTKEVSFYEMILFCK